MEDSICDSLLIKIATGDTDALKELYTEMNKTVFCYALSIVKNKPLADDITQDVFVKIKLNSDKYQTDKSPTGWILTLTKHTAFDALKKQKRELPLDLYTEEIAGLSDDDLDDSLMLKGALEKLSLTERQIIMLYLVAGVPQKNIAKLLSLPATTVNWRYRTGLKKLADILEKGGDKVDRDRINNFT